MLNWFLFQRYIGNNVCVVHSLNGLIKVRIQEHKYLLSCIRIKPAGKLVHMWLMDIVQAKVVFSNRDIGSCASKSVHLMLFSHAWRECM